MHESSSECKELTAPRTGFSSAIHCIFASHSSCRHGGRPPRRTVQWTSIIFLTTVVLIVVQKLKRFMIMKPAFLARSPLSPRVCRQFKLATQNPVPIRLRSESCSPASLPILNSSPMAERRLVNPHVAYPSCLEGGDPHRSACATAPSFTSPELAEEMAEMYWLALARYIPWATSPTKLNPLVAAYSKCRKGTRSASFTLRNPRMHHRLAEITGQRLRSPQIHFDGGRLDGIDLHLSQAEETGSSPFLKLDKQGDVAFGPESVRGIGAIPGYQPTYVRRSATKRHINTKVVQRSPATVTHEDDNSRPTTFKASHAHSSWCEPNRDSLRMGWRSQKSSIAGWDMAMGRVAMGFTPVFSTMGEVAG